jgi:hypothetical protein
MKAGRPSSHVRSKWLTVAIPSGVLSFELDTKGNLVKSPATVLKPHHVIGTPPPANIAPKQPLTVPILAAQPSSMPVDTMLFWDDITTGSSWFADDNELTGTAAIDSSTPDLLGLVDDW